MWMKRLVEEFSELPNTNLLSKLSRGHFFGHPVTPLYKIWAYLENGCSYGLADLTVVFLFAYYLWIDYFPENF